MSGFTLVFAGVDYALTDDEADWLSERLTEDFWEAIEADVQFPAIDVRDVLDHHLLNWPRPPRWEMDAEQARSVLGILGEEAVVRQAGLVALRDDLRRQFS